MGINHIEGFLVRIKHCLIVTEVDSYLVAVRSRLTIRFFFRRHNAAYGALCLTCRNQILPVSFNRNQITVRIYLAVILNVSTQFINSIIFFDALAGIRCIVQFYNTIRPFSGTRIVDAVVTLCGNNIHRNLTIFYLSLVDIIGVLWRGRYNYIWGSFITFWKLTNCACGHVSSIITEINRNWNFRDRSAAVCFCFYNYLFTSCIASLPIFDNVLNPLCIRIDHYILVGCNCFCQ